jgi:hypothetical protein
MFHFNHHKRRLGGEGATVFVIFINKNVLYYTNLSIFISIFPIASQGNHAIFAYATNRDWWSAEWLSLHTEWEEWAHTYEKLLDSSSVESSSQQLVCHLQVEGGYSIAI